MVRTKHVLVVAAVAWAIPLSGCFDDGCVSADDCGAGRVCVDMPVDSETTELQCVAPSNCPAKEPNTGDPLCVAGSKKCHGDGGFYTCDQRMPDTGCTAWNKKTTTCSDSGACIGEEGEAKCVPTCAKNDACLDGQKCGLQKGNGILRCGTITGPTVASSCTVTIKDATLVNKPATWDVGFGDATKPDPKVKITFPTADALVAGQQKNTLTPKWNIASKPLSFAEIAGMTVEMADADSSIVREISNDDDRMGKWDPDGGRWFMADPKGATFTLEATHENKLSILRVDVSCKN